MSKRALVRGDKKIINAWALYDWANSVYALVISTAIFPIFYGAVTAIKKDGLIVQDTVTFFGSEYKNTELVSYVMAASYLIVAFLSPILSGIADHSGNKKFFMKIFCYIGSTSCALLFFFDPNHLEISMIPVLLGSVGFWGSIVFYNAFLPEIAEREEHDKISAKGFSYGYLGSGILLIICLILIMGIGDEYTRWAFVLTGVWWFGFAQLTFQKLPEALTKKETDYNILKSGFLELNKVWNQLKQTVRLKRYLLGFFVYSMGVQTIMIMSVFYAEKEIIWNEGDETSGLIISILLIQFIAIPGSYAHSKLSSKIGNIKTIICSVVLWMALCIVAWFIYTPIEFYVTACFVGFIMGGIQSLSRATYSKFLPDTKDHASFFSFYDVCEKVGLVIGTFSFGLIEGLTGSMRNSILVVGAFFVVGLIILFTVPKEEVNLIKR